MKRSFVSKAAGAVTVVALATALFPSLGAYAGVDVDAEQTIRVPGGIGAFSVGPIETEENGQTVTHVAQQDVDGIKNLAITLDASRGGEISTEGTYVGKVADCPSDALLNTSLNVTLSGSSAATADMYVEFDRESLSADGTTRTLTHVWLDDEGNEQLTPTPFFGLVSNSGQQSRGFTIKRICVLSPLS